MKILIITYYWPPSGGPGVQRWLKFVKYLPAFGICPVVLTVDPTRAEYPILDASLEADVDAELKVYRTNCTGIYDLYKKFTGSKTAPYSGFANEGKPNLLQKIARFVRGNFFIPDARRGWIKYAFAEACHIIEKYGINTVITTGPPHSTHLTGLKLKKKYNIKWIVDFRDPWTTIYYTNSLYKTRWAKRIDQRKEQSVLDACDHLLLVADERETLKIAPSKVSFIPNGFDTHDFCNKQPTAPAVFTICYTGTIAESYPTEKLIEALTLFKQEFVFKLRFIGKLSDNIKNNFIAHLGDYVEFVNFVPHDEAINMMMSANVLLAMVAKVENSKYILTGKLFEYLASGKQILFVGPTDSKAANIIREANAGAAFDYNDAQGIRDFFIQQYDYHIKQTYPPHNRDIINQFSRERLTQQLAEILVEKSTL